MIKIFRVRISYDLLLTVRRAPFKIPKVRPMNYKNVSHEQKRQIVVLSPIFYTFKYVRDNTEG